MQTIPGPDGAMHFPAALPAHEMKTYSLIAPLSTHWQAVPCEAYRCDEYLHGWVSLIDESTDLGQAQARWIRTGSGRGFTEERRPDGLTAFTFEAGQRGFASDDPDRDHRRHMVRVDRPEIAIVRGGDWRGNPRQEVRRHASVDDWQEDSEEHQARIAELVRRG